jgi:hypothetical protein
LPTGALSGQLLPKKLLVKPCAARYREGLEPFSSVCGLDDLLGPSPEEAGGAPGKALGPRVAGPATAPGDVQPVPSTPSPPRVDLRAGRAAASKEPAVATDQLAEIA